MLDSEPALAGGRVRAQVTADSITLTGTVTEEGQRDMALKLAESVAGKRKIVDKIKVRG
jgi:osmotically-inducible protein OsmY